MILQEGFTKKENRELKHDDWGFVWLPSENLTIFDIHPYSLFILVWAVVWDVCPLMMPLYLLMSEQLIFCVDMVYKTAGRGPCCLLTDQLFTGRTQNKREQKALAELSCVHWLHLTISGCCIISPLPWIAWWVTRVKSGLLWIMLTQEPVVESVSKTRPTIFRPLLKKLHHIAGNCDGSQSDVDWVTISFLSDNDRKAECQV